MDKFPIVFMSYVRADDEHEHGRITEFCKRLSGEVHFQIGKPFNIFQDKKDIAWGQQWENRIDECLDACTFLILIITPSFFNSPACRHEVERFLAREAALGRNDLILPIYYFDCPILNEELKRNVDPLAKLINERNYVDWRDHRFKPFTSRPLATMLAKLATQIAQALLSRKSAPDEEVATQVADRRSLPRRRHDRNERPEGGKSRVANTSPPGIACRRACAPQTTRRYRRRRAWGGST
jgi:hypothetical protein